MSSSDPSNNLLPPTHPVIFGYDVSYNIPDYYGGIHYQTLGGFAIKTETFSTAPTYDSPVMLNGLWMGVWHVTATYSNLTISDSHSFPFIISLGFLDGNSNYIPTFYSGGSPTTEFTDASTNGYSPLQTCTPLNYSNSYSWSQPNSGGNYPITINVSGHFYNPNITNTVNNGNSYAATWVNAGGSTIQYSSSTPVITMMAVRIA